MEKNTKKTEKKNPFESKSAAIAFAKKNTLKAAKISDSNLRYKIDFKRREFARKLAKGKGYIIAKPSELAVKYPEMKDLWNLNAWHNKNFTYKNDKLLIWFVMPHMSLGLSRIKYSLGLEPF